MQKRLLIFLVFILPVISMLAQAGKWELRIEANPNLCSKYVLNNRVYGTGYDVLSFRDDEGFSIKCNFSEHFRLGSGIIYSEKGDNSTPPVALRNSSNIYVATVPGKIHETFDYLEMPVLLDYFLTHKTIYNPYVSLGYINAFLVRGEAETIYSYPGLPGEYIHRQVYSAAELHHNNARIYSGSVFAGAGVERYFANRFNLSVEPNAQYSALPFHSNTSGGSVHLYSFGINVGLGYRF